MAIANGDSPIEFLEKILTYELTKREEKSIERRMKQATFRYGKVLEEFNLEE